MKIFPIFSSVILVTSIDYEKVFIEFKAIFKICQFVPLSILIFFQIDEFDLMNNYFVNYICQIEFIST